MFYSIIFLIQKCDRTNSLGKAIRDISQYTVGSHLGRQNERPLVLRYIISIFDIE